MPNLEVETYDIIVYMKIAIIGAGNLGKALAEQFIKSGHEVYFGVKNVTEKNSEISGVKILSIQEAALLAEVIIPAIPATAAVEVAHEIGSGKNKILLDPTNALRGAPEGYSDAYSAFKALLPDIEIAKAFNSSGFENLSSLSYDGVRADFFVAGGSQKAKDVASYLAKEIGFGEIYDFGGDDKVGLLEQFAFAWINLAIMQKYGRDIAFKILKHSK